MRDTRDKSAGNVATPSSPRKRGPIPPGRTALDSRFRGNDKQGEVRSRGDDEPFSGVFRGTGSVVDDPRAGPGPLGIDLIRRRPYHFGAGEIRRFDSRNSFALSNP
jgi:hypothetical protein